MHFNGFLPALPLLSSHTYGRYGVDQPVSYQVLSYVLDDVELSGALFRYRNISRILKLDKKNAINAYCSNWIYVIPTSVLNRLNKSSNSNDIS
jgi:hypothetical protein